MGTRLQDENKPPGQPGQSGHVEGRRPLFRIRVRPDGVLTITLFQLSLERYTAKKILSAHTHKYVFKVNHAKSNLANKTLSLKVIQSRVSNRR